MLRFGCMLLVAACASPQRPAPPAAPPAQPKVDVYADPNSFDAPPLAVGDPAPALAATAWIGAPVAELRGRVHLVEFWATWCQPCQKSIPEMKRLARAHGDRLRVVGVAAAEAGDAAGVREFAARAGIDYSLAYVDDDEATFKRWMRAARVSGLPWVFIIDAEGRVAWWGQPFETEFVPELERALAGGGDLAAARRRFEERQARAARGWPLQDRALGAIREGRVVDAVAMIDELASIDASRFWYVVEAKFALLLDKRSPEEAYAYGRRIVAGASHDNPHALLDIGAAILDAKQAKRDLTLAEEALARAGELTHGENPDILRATARLRVAQGRREDAAKLLDSAARYAPPGEQADIAKERAVLP